MRVIPELIAQYAAALYALCALGVLFYIRTALLARREESLAVFTLEREGAIRRQTQAWMMAFLFVALAGGVYVVANYVTPRLPPATTEAAPTLPPGLFTPTPSPAPTPTPSPTPTLVPTVDLGPVPTLPPPATPTPALAVSATPTAGPAPACVSAGTQLIRPTVGAQLSGIVEVWGTASIPDFQFYKFEIQAEGSNEWVTIQSFPNPVVNGLLGTWDASPLPPGNYLFRLVVVDNTGNFPEPCVVPIVIVPPTPSETSSP